MKREIPMLTITLQIPLVPGIDAQDVLEALAQTLTEALEQVREQAEQSEAEDPSEEEASEDAELRPTLNSPETLEAYSEETRADLLASLGYSDRP